MSIEVSDPSRLELFFRGEFDSDWQLWMERLTVVFFKPLFPKAKSEFKELREDIRRLDKASKSLETAAREMDALKVTRTSLLAAHLSRKGVSTDLWLDEVSGILKELGEARADLKRFTSSLSPIGGKDVFAEHLADAIANVFDEFGEPVTYGQSHDGHPSTRYCRLVQFAVSYHGFDVHWRRPAEFGFRETKKRQTEPERAIPNPTEKK